MRIRNVIKNALTSVIMLVAFAAAMCLAPIARAQSGQSVGVVDFITAGTLTNSVTWAQGGTVDISKQSMCGLSVRFQGAASSTSDIVVKLARSADGTNFETSPPSTLSFTNALNGTNVVIGYFQIPRDVVGSVRTLKLLSVQNASGSVNATNATISIVKKYEPYIP